MTLSRRTTLTALLAATAGSTFKATAQDAEPLRVGALLALSGPAALFGTPTERALRSMVDSLGAGGLGGRRVELTIYDSEGSSTKAVQLFRRLVEHDQVQVVVGPNTSGESLALVPVANQMKVPIITFGGAEAITKPVTPYVFCMAATDRLVVEILLADFKKRNIDKIGLIYSVDAFGQSGGGLVKELAPANGISVVADESFGPQDTNVTPQLLRMRNAPVQALLVWSGNPGPSIVFRNASEINWGVRKYASYASGTRAFLQQTGASAEGVVVPTYRIVAPEALPDSDPIKTPLLDFAKIYRARWQADPDLTSGHGYDSIVWLGEALKTMKGPLTRSSLRDALESVRFNGANGPRQLTATDHRGLDRTTLVVMAGKKGRWVAPDM